MKLGLGLYRHMLRPENYRFARQAGATHIVAHLVDYWHDSQRIPGTDSARNWGRAGDPASLWTASDLLDLRKSIEAEGLKLAAIENFDPAHWHDVLLDGPRKKEQLENLKTLVRRVGQAGIPAIGYNFSIAGVWGHVVGPFARGGAESVAFLGPEGPREEPIPNGPVWNMTYDADAPEGVVGPVTSDQLWSRLAEFLHEIVPVAEESGVRMAAHPDDPPMPAIRGAARLVNQPALYQKLLDLHPSRSNGIEFCQGTIAEMTEGDVYEAIDRYTRQRAIVYVHLRNVVGKVPRYHEVFIDEGDVDMVKALGIYRHNGYDGVLTPDHTPQMTCEAPWHAGMAYALGYIKGVLQAMERSG
jgi:mannonate dehydratase